MSKSKPEIVLISALVYPLFSLGFGKRGGIFFQGCSIRCPGCMAQDTWPFDPKKAVPLKDIEGALTTWVQEGIDGLTISGGEPFDQGEALLHILKFAHRIGIPEIFVYSGYSFDFLTKKYSHVLPYIDLLMSEPYQEHLPTRKPWRGSDNQVLHIISARAQARYAHQDLNAPSSFPETVHVTLSDTELMVIGLFSRNAREKVRKCLEGVGYGPYQGMPSLRECE
ncbi:4Fe-4S single cluster domain-containing protein [Candidatus Caldatribacterium sp.]|uniref:4Fe-4S single cluster domain-containing protein n=1 Tax=Candidatus Caldatribacterium sp. TaxID=2282143 RepID=UPI00299C02B5|nr:radical SAM protein [Candidatus Caldatribacterium sp.]MDW8082099.1 4Fe-4S single cluster domain-containing protein [Candidatus Calescibacterium sp.]